MFKIIKNTIWQGLGKIVVVGIGLVTTSLLIRNLGESQYGLFSLIGSSFLVIDALADMGTKIIGVREISKSKDKQKTFKNLFFLRFILMLVGLGLGLILVFSYPTFKGHEKEAIMALVMCFLTFIAGNLEVIFQTNEQMGKKSMVDSLFPLLFLGLYLLTPIKTTIFMVFGLYIVARILSLLVGMGLVKRTIETQGNVFRAHDYAPVQIKRLFWASVPMGLFLFLFTVYDRAIDNIIIDRYLGINEVAWYSLAYKVYGNLVMPAYFLVTSAFPSFSREAKENRKNTYRKIMVISVGLSLVIWPIVWLGAPVAMKMLSGTEFNWQVSTQVLRILSLGLVFNFINHVKGFYLISRDGEKKMLVLGVISLVFNLGANLVFVPMYGVIGAAWVTMATEVLMTAIYILVNKV